MARDYTTANSSLVVDKESFKDLDLPFTAPPISGDLVAKKDSDAIKQSIKNIILTNHYERPFKPSFGSNLRNRLFEPNDFQNRSLIKKDIVSEINALEPRVSNVSVVMRQLENEVSLTIEYVIKGQADYNSVEFLVSRVR